MLSYHPESNRAKRGARRFAIGSHGDFREIGRKSIAISAQAFIATIHPITTTLSRRFEPCHGQGNDDAFMRLGERPERGPGLLLLDGG